MSSHLLQFKSPLPITPRRVAVLMGGWSDERSVSLISGENVAKSLTELGHHVVCLDPSPQLKILVQQIEKAFPQYGHPTQQPELIFNALHGTPGECGLFQGVLDFLKIPYTSSGILASALGMNKPLSRIIASSVGIACPPGQVMTASQYQEDCPLPLPHVLKPINNGSNVGVTWIGTNEERYEAARTWSHGSSILVEAYIPGREFSVGILGGKAIGIIEALFSEKIFPFHGKFGPGYTQYTNPTLDPDLKAQLFNAAEKIYHAHGCRGMARVDFRYDNTIPAGKFYYLEINTQPGLTPFSMLPQIVAYQGLSFTDFIQWILEDTLCGFQEKA